MSRLLTREDFGYYATITAITAIFATFSETGIGSAIVQRKNVDENYLNNAFTLSVVIGCFLMFALMSLSGVLASSFVDSSIQLPLILISITLLMRCITSINLSVLQRNLEFYKMGFCKLFTSIITTVVAICLAVKGFGYYAILTKAILDSLLLLVFSFLFAKIKLSISWNPEIIKSIFGFSGWLMAGVLFRNLSLQIDKLLMSRLFSVSALGAYNRPKEFINQISSNLNNIFDTTLFPILSKIQDDKSKLIDAYKTSLYYMNAFALFLSLGFIFNARLIIQIFFGSEWLNLEVVFQILSVALLFNIDGRLSDCYLRSLALTKQQFCFRVAEFCFKIIAILIAVQWDLLGIAIAIVATNSIMAIIKILYIGKKLNIGHLDVLKTILFSWKSSLIAIPIFLIFRLYLQQSILNNVIMLLVFLVVTLSFFICFPNVVGEKYKAEFYPKIILKLKQCFKKTLKN